MKIAVDVYVISLPGSENTDRRKKIVTEFKRVNLKFKFFDATVGTDLDSAWISCNVADEYRSMFYSGRYDWLTKASLACADSHRRLARHFLDSGRDACMVFEDDVCLESDFFSEFPIKKDSLLAYKIVFLNHSFIRKKFPRVLLSLNATYRLIAYPEAGILNASGYILTRDAAAMVCRSQYPKIQDGADSWSAVLGHLAGRSALVWPRPVSTGYQKSSIRRQSALRRMLIYMLKIPVLRRIYEERQRWSI